MLFAMKKLIYIVLWPLLVMERTPNVIAYRLLPAEFMLQIESENSGKMSINLKRVNSILANENLPVMRTNAEDGPKYIELDENVMDKIGKFVMYHDYDSKSAFVYFRKRGIFNGVIDVRFHIKNLHIDDIHKVQRVKEYSPKYLNRLFSKRILKLSRKLRFTDGNTTKIRRRRGNTQDLPIIYPELLVAISYDMHKAIGSNYVKTISHVLTVYNGADMLYKLVKSAVIHLNIAAIVIEATEGSWDFIPSSADGNTIIVDTNEVNLAISLHFEAAERYFPEGTYDYIAYNTRRTLLHRAEKTILHGVSLRLTSHAILFPFNKWKRYIRSNMAIMDYEGYESYSTVAHELAHIFTAEHDEENPQFVDHTCSRGSSIMANTPCNEVTLKWSEQSEMEFTQFFRSLFSCILRNFPISVLPSPRKPRMKLTGNEQCQCYGYKSFIVPLYYTPDWCKNSLNCLDADDKVQNELPLPFDGTPCGKDRVCWQKSCVYLNEIV